MFPTFLMKHRTSGKKSLVKVGKKTKGGPIPGKFDFKKEFPDEKTPE